MAFKCIPLNPAWTGTTKLDLRAVYKRKNGDLCSNLPLRGHHAWEAKGLEYVTLADAESFERAVPFIRSSGLNPADYICGIDGDGRQTCWNAQMYLADQKVAAGEAEKELAALVEEHGVDAVEAITGKPVPAHLRPKVAAPEEVVVADSGAEFSGVKARKAKATA